MLWDSGRGLMLRLIISASFFFALFDLLGGLELKQSLILALCFSWITVDGFPGKPKPVIWSPFWIRFNPNFAEMLIAIRIIEKAEDWGKCLLSRDSPPPSHLDIERYPQFTAVTLARPTDKESGVMAWHPWGSFGTSYEIQIPLLAAAYPDEPGAPPYSDIMRSFSCPTFFIKKTIEGYSFGLEVKKSWWEKLKLEVPEIGSLVFVEERGNFFLPDAAFLTMGVIPFWQMFGQYLCYYQPSAKQRSKANSQRLLALEKYAWQTKEANWEVQNDPEVLNHRFMKITSDRVR